MCEREKEREREKGASTSTWPAAAAPPYATTSCYCPKRYTRSRCWSCCCRRRRREEAAHQLGVVGLRVAPRGTRTRRARRASRRTRGFKGALPRISRFRDSRTFVLTTFLQERLIGMPGLRSFPIRHRNAVKKRSTNPLMIERIYSLYSLNHIMQPWGFLWDFL